MARGVPTEDLHQLLGVPCGASSAEIKRGYKEAAKEEKDKLIQKFQKDKDAAVQALESERDQHRSKLEEKLAKRKRARQKKAQEAARKAKQDKNIHMLGDTGHVLRDA